MPHLIHTALNVWGILFAIALGTWLALAPFHDDEEPEQYE